MSARQRHSRVAAADGWTTIKSPRRAKYKSTSTATASALLAHKSDLTSGDSTGDAESDDHTPTEAEVAKVAARLEKQIAAFNASSCCAKLKELLRTELNIQHVQNPSSSSSLQDGDEHAVSRDAGRPSIFNVLILALGSISDSFGPAPGYQLAAALTILDVLREQSTSITSMQMQILSYDPVYTALDKHILSSIYNITILTAAKIPGASDEEWYRHGLVYMPHASVWLNHAYFIRRPHIWIGNSFAIYEAAMAGLRRDEDESEGDNGADAGQEADKDNGGEVQSMLKAARGVMRDYKTLEWPEEAWGGGAVFNNLVVYVRKGDDESGLADAVAALKLEK
ncbi:hypothetical protein ABW21_db0204813 [Orbilia brochopaga]|nr:hypothetical protein ABW21_db0204813 [Drechslerella brochopaga]